MSEVIPAQDAAPQLPVFTYGSLSLGGMERLLGQGNIISNIRAYTVGVRKGTGDLFPCADVTHDITDTTEGELYFLGERTYERSIAILDDYEGVEDGYYRRCITFAQKFSDSRLFVPAWLYVRGEKL